MRLRIIRDEIASLLPHARFQSHSTANGEVSIIAELVEQKKE